MADTVKTSYALAALLTFAILTLWVSERWALSCVEVSAYLAACSIIVIQRGRLRIGMALLAPALMCVWAAIQWTLHWSAVPSATVDSCLYWLAVACFALIGGQVNREIFLKTAFAIGSLIAIIGTIQLFTSPGNVFWLFPSGFDRRVIGPFVSPNNYAAFVELLIPLAMAHLSWRTHSGVQPAPAPETLHSRTDSQAVCSADWQPVTDYQSAFPESARSLALGGPAFARSANPGSSHLSGGLPVPAPRDAHAGIVIGARERGHSGSSVKFQNLLIAAALAATVVASGSRAGAVLVLLEISTVLALQRWNRKAVLTFALLTAAFSLIAGQQFLTSRFAQKTDFFAVRREFLISSLAMFRAQPLHGFGLGTWPSVYPQFAIIDTGETANHAHNEWAQWAAEGGVPALAVMLGLLFWTARPAVRSIWALGIPAVFVHALVDYPFLRLGLAVWIFAFLGVLSSGKRFRRNLPFAAAIPALLFGAWQASKLAYADALFRQTTASSVKRAATLAPDRAEYQTVLAQLDSSRAAAHFDRALAANPYNTQARIGLALERELAGDREGAALLLLATARYDHQFAPDWALANFYFRNGETDRFWMWAQRAAGVSYGSRRALFDLCLLASDNVHTVFERIVAPLPTLKLPFLTYLMSRHRFADAAALAIGLADRPTPAARDALLDYIDGAIESGDAAAAWRVRNQLAGGQGLLVNGDFGAPLSNRGFDWRVEAADGVGVTRTQVGGTALSIDFSGREPESCELLNHPLALQAGATYVMHFEYRTEDLPAQTGISWRMAPQLPAGPIGDASAREPSPSVPGLPRVFALDASANWIPAQWRFQASGAANLQLSYGRTRGNTRAEGRLFLRNAGIEIAPL